MANKDFQNGFISGLAVKGNIKHKAKPTSPNIQIDSCVAQVILPVTIPTVTVDINNGIIQADSSASLEE